jgi:HK97 family phage portal protein
MKLFGLNLSFPQTRSQRPDLLQREVPAEFGPADWLRGEDQPANFGVRMSNAYQQVVWVYRAVNILAEQVASIPFLFSSGARGEESLITSGPLPGFYERPHPHIDRFQYWELRILWLMLRGECMRVPVFEERGGRRVLVRVLILDPAQFQHVVENHQLVGWRYTGIGSEAPLASQVFLPEEVWFDRLANPFDFWRGISPLRVAGLACETDLMAGAFMKGILENNADLGVLIRTEKPIDPDQGAQLLAALRQRKRRAGTADRPMLLPGCAEIIKPGLSSSDLQFLENRKFSRGEICAAFGVPEELVISTDHAKYDVMEGARLNFIENRVAPLCARLEAGEQACVRLLQPEAVGWFDLDALPILQQARRERLSAARMGFEMGIPFNQLNRVLDLGFKPLPWGDRGHLPTNLREIKP